MPELDALRHSIPDEHDDFDPEAWFTNYSLTAPTIVEVESPTEANTVRAAYLNEASQAGVPRRGLYVWVDNIHQLWRDNQDGGWEVIGGRRHAATVEFSRNVIGSPSSPLVLYAQDVTDASPGFTIVGGGEGSPEGRNVVLPASGWWTMSANNVRLTGAASNVGRVFFQFSSADGGGAVRAPVLGAEREPPLRLHHRLPAGRGADPGAGLPRGRRHQDMDGDREPGVARTPLGLLIGPPTS